MLKLYIRLAVSPVSIEQSTTLLTGSVTNAPMMVSNVTVEDYQNGFASEPNGFGEITFD